jgi:hypothetical protein
MQFSAASIEPNLWGHPDFSLYKKNDQAVNTYRTNPYPLYNRYNKTYMNYEDFSSTIGDTHEGLSLTCLVNVRTLMTSPNGFVISNRLSSGKLGGKPLMYTFGVFKPGLALPLSESILGDG